MRVGCRRRRAAHVPLALVASRATGETDITPTGATGKIAQLMYGLPAPGNMRLGVTCLPAHEAASSWRPRPDLAVIDDRVLEHMKKYTVSSTAGGIAPVIPAWNGISMFIGGFLSWVFAKLHARKAERYSLALTAGFSATASLVAVLAAALMAANLLQAG